jgi:hypothetical protein
MYPTKLNPTRLKKRLSIVCKDRGGSRRWTGIALFCWRVVKVFKFTAIDYRTPRNNYYDYLTPQDFYNTYLTPPILYNTYLTPSEN